MPRIQPSQPAAPRTTSASDAARPATTPGDSGAQGRWGTSSTSSAERRAKATSVTTQPAPLDDAARGQVAIKKATCPFIGAAVKDGALPVRNDAEKPLASIDDVVKLGNTGPGSNLGEVLRLFAQGNHAYMQGDSGTLDTPVPLGTFSLDFPGSQGSHAGHSGILQGDPTQLNSGRLSPRDFDRLLAYAKDGHISRSDLGRFIADNIEADPKAKAPGLRTGLALAKDSVQALEAFGQSVKDRAVGKADPQHDRRVLEKLTRVLGEDNLIGSSGEFGLMATFLQNSPRTTQVKHGLVGAEPAYSVDDLRAMFVDKRLPPGWDTWKKTAGDWVANTTAIALAAEKAHLT